MEVILARVIATYRRRRSSSSTAEVPAPKSDGMQPSTTLRTYTDFHSWTRTKGGISTSAAEALLQRVLDRIGEVCSPKVHSEHFPADM
jgi:hypothetical protein